MGKQVTLTTLMSDVRFEFDLDASSSRVSDAQLTRAINRARDELFLFLLQRSGHFMDATAELTTQAGVGFVSLPARFYSLTSLRLRIDSERSPELRAARPDEIQYDLSSTESWGDGCLPIYWPAQGLLYFWPPPQGVYTLDCAYVEGFVDLAAGSDSWDCQPGWDAWVIARTLLRLHSRSKDAERYQLTATELERLSGQIEASVGTRDAHSPPMARRIAHFWDRGVRTSAQDRWGTGEDS